MTVCFIASPHTRRRRQRSRGRTGSRKGNLGPHIPLIPDTHRREAMSVARKKAAHAQRGKADVSPHNALVLLTAEHNEIEKLAREFERLRKTDDSVEKGKAALRICHAFELH